VTTALGDETSARDEFARTCALVCHRALDPALEARLTAACDRAAFVSDHVEGLGHRTIEQPALAGRMLTLLLHREPLFRWLERVTGCAPIRAVEGRVVQTHAVPGDELAWHDDMNGPHRRRLGVTLALTSPPYEGGLFELRRVGESALLRFIHDSPGTMLVFKISPALEHRVHPLTAGGPRRVYTGWFVG
jgi:hypothetical protein